MSISVCMATYNGEKYIKQQIDSILPQLSEDDELVISDDSSSDGTVSIVLSYNDKRIKLFEKNSFHSPIYNFENAISKSIGEIIVLSDQDDLWYDNRLKVIKMLFDANKDSLCLLHNYSLINRNGEVMQKYAYSKGEDVTKVNFLKALITRNVYIGCCMAFKRELLKYALPFPKKLAMHDVWLGLLAKKLKSVMYIDTPLVYYRRHTENFSSDDPYTLMYRISYRWIILKNLIYRIYLK